MDERSKGHGGRKWDSSIGCLLRQVRIYIHGVSSAASLSQIKKVCFRGQGLSENRVGILHPCCLATQQFVQVHRCTDAELTLLDLPMIIPLAGFQNICTGSFGCGF